MKNEEIVDWSLFKGKSLESAKASYVNFCKMLRQNNHVLLGEYFNATSKVLIDFNCGHRPHEISPDKYKQGRGCPECAKAVKANKKIEKSKSEFLDLISKNNHRLLSEYMGAKVKVLIDFNCGHEPHWITPDGYKRGRSCPECPTISSRQAKEDFMNMLNKNGHVLLSEYKDNSSKVKIDFNCGHEPYWITPNSYKQGGGCLKCAKNCPEQAKEDFMNMLNENNHILLSEYKDNSSKVLVDFGCGHEPHWIAPSKYKVGRKCPHCKNKGEGELHKLIIDMGYEVESRKTFEDLRNKRCLPYDFFIPSHNLLIELDGEHHRRAVPYKSKNMSETEKDMAEIDAEIRFHYRQNLDKIKDDYAKSNNIHLLRIEYNSKIEINKWKKIIENKIGEIELYNLNM